MRWSLPTLVVRAAALHWRLFHEADVLKVLQAPRRTLGVAVEEGQDVLAHLPLLQRVRALAQPRELIFHATLLGLGRAREAALRRHGQLHRVARAHRAPKCRWGGVGQGEEACHGEHVHRAITDEAPCACVQVSVLASLCR